MPRKLVHAGAVTAFVAIPLASFVSTAHAAPPETASEPENTYCSTNLLTPAEMQAGVTSVIHCYPTFDASLGAVGVRAPAGVTASAAMETADVSGLVAIHYKMNNGIGQYLAIAGTTCNGGGISFNAGDPWNDVITSTRHQSCSQVKHWSDANFSGAEETTNGGSGTIVTLRSVVAGQVSSIKYFGPVN